MRLYNRYEFWVCHGERLCDWLRYRSLPSLVFSMPYLQVSRSPELFGLILVPHDFCSYNNVTASVFLSETEF